MFVASGSTNAYIENTRVLLMLELFCHRIIFEIRVLFTQQSKKIQKVRENKGSKKTSCMNSPVHSVSMYLPMNSKLTIVTPIYKAAKGKGKGGPGDPGNYRFH